MPGVVGSEWNVAQPVDQFPAERRNLYSDGDRYSRPAPRRERLVQPPRVPSASRARPSRASRPVPRPQTYGGPATPGTALAGSCTDNAGKVASASLPLSYDATPPALAASSQPADGSVHLTWQASAGPAPLQWVQVARDPGVAPSAASLLYQGGGNSYQDKRVRNGTRYTYTITAMDQAGNVAQETVTAKPGMRLLAPAAGASLSAPPALSWTAIPKASYYNVQLFKGKTKVLSAWPTKAGLHLKRTWRFGGHRHRLARGTYRWYVWPGFGSRKAAHYGHVVGTATFVIR